jgi:hypothetical protein
MELWKIIIIALECGILAALPFVMIRISYPKWFKKTK